MSDPTPSDAQPVAWRVTDDPATKAAVAAVAAEMEANGLEHDRAAEFIAVAAIDAYLSAQPFAEAEAPAPARAPGELGEAWQAAYDFIASEYRDEKSAALDGTPFAKEARPIIAVLSTALSRLTPPKQDDAQ